MDNAAAPSAPQVPTQPVLQQGQSAPVQSVSAPVGGKEHEAAPIVAVAPSHPEEVVLPEAVKEAGVRVENASKQEIQLDKSQTDAGIRPSGPANPSPTYTLPLTEEEVGETLKKPDTKLSITWLAQLIARVLLQRK